MSQPANINRVPKSIFFLFFFFDAFLPLVRHSVTTGRIFDKMNKRNRGTSGKGAKGPTKKRKFQKRSRRPSSKKVALKNSDSATNQAIFGPTQVDSFQNHIKAVSGTTGGV